MIKMMNEPNETTKAAMQELEDKRVVDQLMQAIAEKNREIEKLIQANKYFRKQEKKLYEIFDEPLKQKAGTFQFDKVVSRARQMKEENAKLQELFDAQSEDYNKLEKALADALNMLFDMELETLKANTGSITTEKET